jgi:hypothetical protein
MSLGGARPDFAHGSGHMETWEAFYPPKPLEKCRKTIGKNIGKW